MVQYHLSRVEGTFYPPIAHGHWGCFHGNVYYGYPGLSFPWLSLDGDKLF